jgi:hypothetical protein
MIDEEEIERMISDLTEAVEENPGQFSKWERDFIESVEENNDGGHLSERQREKLEELHDKHC